MSTYEWEIGEFNIPSTEWAGFKAKIRDEINKLHSRQLEVAKQLYDRLVVLQKSDRNLVIQYAAFDEIEKLRVPDNRWSLNPQMNLPKSDEETVAIALSKYCSKTKKERLVKPTQKMFPKLGNNVTEFSNLDCSLTFDNASKKVYWDVPENNHACDRARESCLGKIFFRSLDAVKWTRGSGGRIWGGDEYHSAAARESGFGGDSYEKGAWGPKEPKRSSNQDASLSSGYIIYNKF